jgi:Mg2+/citrate symporter
LSFLHEGFFRLIIITSIGILTFLFLVWSIGLNEEERVKIKDIIQSRIFNFSKS